MAKQEITGRKDVAAPVPGEEFGVDRLIGRLRDEGIESGRGEARALLDEARKQATDIRAEASKEADAIVRRAKEEAAKLTRGGEEAVRLALRDTILSLDNELVSRFETRLRNLVGGTLSDPEFLKKMILEVCRAAGSEVRGKGGKAELLLPAEIVSLQELQQRPETVRPGTLSAFVLSLSEEMMRAGLNCGVDDRGEAGFRISMDDGSVQVHVTRPAVMEMMIKHMIPRFRALLRGAVVVEPAAESEGRKLVKT